MGRSGVVNRPDRFTSHVCVCVSAGGDRTTTVACQSSCVCELVGQHVPLSLGLELHTQLGRSDKHVHLYF